MSRIFKKLNIEEESPVERMSPDLKLVLPTVEESRPAIPPAFKIQKKYSFKSLLKPLLILTVCAVVGVGGYYVYHRISHFADQLVAKPTTPPAIERASVKARLAGDAQIHHEAMELYRTHDYAKALEKFESLLQRYPKDAALMNNIGMTYLKLNNFQKAESAFQEVLKTEPKDGAAYSNLGSLKMAERNWEEAIAYYYQAILYQPEIIEPHLNLAKAFEMAGRPMEAIPEYQYYLDHPVTGGDPELKKLIEKRIVKLNSYSSYLK